MTLSSKLKAILIFTLLSLGIFLVLPIKYQQMYLVCNGPVLLSNPPQCGQPLTIGTELENGPVSRMLWYRQHAVEDKFHGTGYQNSVTTDIRSVDVSIFAVLIRALIALVISGGVLYLAKNRMRH